MTDEITPRTERHTVHGDIDEQREDAAQPSGSEAAEQAGLANAIRHATPDTPESREAAEDR